MSIEHEGRAYRVKYHFEPFLDQGFAGLFAEMEQADEPERQAALHREALRRLVVAWDVEDAAGHVAPLMEAEARSVIPDSLAAALARGVLDDAKRRAARMKASHQVAAAVTETRAERRRHRPGVRASDVAGTVRGCHRRRAATGSGNGDGVTR